MRTFNEELAEFKKWCEENNRNYRDTEALKDYLGNYMTTDLQKRNLELVINPAYKALCQKLLETLIVEQS